MKKVLRCQVSRAPPGNTHFARLPNYLASMQGNVCWLNTLVQGEISSHNRGIGSHGILYIHLPSNVGQIELFRRRRKVFTQDNFVLICILRGQVDLNFARAIKVPSLWHVRHTYTSMFVENMMQDLRRPVLFVMRGLCTADQP